MKASEDVTKLKFLQISIGVSNDFVQVDGESLQSLVVTSGKIVNHLFQLLNIKVVCIMNIVYCTLHTFQVQEVGFELVSEETMGQVMDVEPYQ